MVNYVNKGNPIISLTSVRLIFGEDSRASNVLAIVSVPDSMDIQETLHYFKEKEKFIKIARILKTEFTKNYTIVLLFDNEGSSENFYEQYSERRFNMLEDDKIVIKKVTGVATDHYLETITELPDSTERKRKESDKHVVRFW